MVGGLALVPAGMWLRGVRVSTSIMHMVAVAPALQKRGIGRALVAGALRELHANRTALCVLYPATDGLYRHAGFHDAGVAIRYRATGLVPAAAERMEHAHRDVERVDRAHLASLRDAYDELARTTNGNLDRNAWLWRRVFESGYGVRVVENGRVVAYAIAHRAGADLHVCDLVALTPDAEECVLGHLVASGPVEWIGSTNTPPVPAERAERVRERTWFARVCNIESALSSLRVPNDNPLRGVGDATLELDVRDELIPENAGRWIVTVRDGATSVRRGGEGHLALDIRDLAALVTGHAIPTGAEPFATAHPWFSDVF